MSRLLHRAALCGVALALSLPALAEDLTIVSKVTAMGSTKTATTYLTSQRYRHGDGDTDTITEFTTGRMVFIDHKRKSYWETTPEETKAAFQRLGGEMDKVNEQLKQNPQAAAMLQKMMGGAASTVTVTKGTNPRTIAGYACDHNIVSMGESMKIEMWTSSAIQPPPAAYDARKLAFAMPGNPMGKNFEKMFEEMKKIKGYPLAEVTNVKIMGPTIQTTSEVVEVKKGPVPDSAFAIPAGYKKVDSPFKSMMTGGR
jgi:hypothetical protein